MIKVTLTTLEVECLLRLAQEAEPETFDNDRDFRRKRKAAERAMDKLATGLAAAAQAAA